VVAAASHNAAAVAIVVSVARRPKHARDGEPGTPEKRAKDSSA
jgi:hypothetical protein